MGGAGVVGESFPLLPHCHYMKESESGEVYVFVCHLLWSCGVTGEIKAPPPPETCSNRVACCAAENVRRPVVLSSVILPVIAHCKCHDS